VLTAAAQGTLAVRAADGSVPSALALADALHPAPAPPPNSPGPGPGSGPRSSRCSREPGRTVLAADPGRGS